MSFWMTMVPCGIRLLHQRIHDSGDARGRRGTGWPPATVRRQRCNEDLAPACGLGVASGLSLILWLGAALLWRHFHG